MWRIKRSTPVGVPFTAVLTQNQNAKYRLDLGSGGTVIGAGDTFKLSVGGQTTAAITYADPMATAIESALEALSGVAAGNTTATRISASVYDVVFDSGKAATDMGLVTITEPVGFTPTGVTVITNGGTAGQYAKYLTWTPATHLFYHKEGGAFAACGGSMVTNDYTGMYFYNPLAGEVDTEGPWVLHGLMADSNNAAKVIFAGANIESAASGQYVIDSGTLQSGGFSSGKLRAVGGPTEANIRGAIYFDSGPGANQVARVVSYNPSTQDIVWDPPLVTAVTGATTYVILVVPPPLFDLNKSLYTIPNSFALQIASLDDMATAVQQKGVTLGQTRLRR